MIPSLPQLSASDAGIAGTGGMSWSGSLLTPVLRLRRRRPSRAKETVDRVVLRAMPKDAVRPAHTDEWVEALLNHPVYEQARSDRQKALRSCVEALAAAADYSTMTARPTWDRLAKFLERARRSVARYVQQLREMGLLAVVASGRSAAYAPAGDDGRKLNEAAVYVLCVPERRSSIRERAARIMGLRRTVVEESVTPPSEAGLLTAQGISPRTHARGESSRSQEQKRLGWSVDQVRWNRHRVPVNRAQQVTAAWRLKLLLPNVLGRMSDRDVASCVRSFFDAGWSVADIHHALEMRPDGSAWPYSGAPATKEPHRVRGWLRFRLSQWCDDLGHPLASRDQQARRNREAARKQQRQHEDGGDRQQNSEGCDSEARTRALKRIKQIFARR